MAEPTKPGLPVLKSAVIPFAVMAKVPPVQLEPENRAQLVIEAADPTVRIKWANPAKLKSLLVQVAEDPQLKNSILQEPLNDKLNFKDITLNKSGAYYWRLTGFMDIKGKLQPVSSEVRVFQVQVGAELVPPELRSPLAQQSISYNQVVEKGLFLSWDPVAGIPAYQVTIEKGETADRRLASIEDVKNLTFTPILDSEVNSSPVRANDLTSGVYRWTVVSVDSNGKKSEPAPYRLFTITDVPRVDWALGPEPENYQYYTKKPALIVKWLKGDNPAVTRWRYKLVPEGSDMDSEKWKVTTTTDLRTYVDTEGTWQILVEALNDKNQTVAKSSVKEVNVTPKPLLPSPNFASELPEVLKANRKGDLSLRWDPVNGAQKYKLMLKNNKGKKVKEMTLTSTNSDLTRLAPGDYQVFLQSVDEHGRNGPVSTGRTLQVPKTSDIKAPKLKTIQVK